MSDLKTRPTTERVDVLRELLTRSVAYIRAKYPGPA